MRLALICLLLMVTRATAGDLVVGNECPMDRPHKKIVASGYVNCTLVACVGPLSCPSNGGECRHLPAKDCNICTEEKFTVCLTDGELETAEREGLTTCDDPTFTCGTTTVLPTR